VRAYCSSPAAEFTASAVDHPITGTRIARS
jgi:hypothetical protein